jgi:aspartate-semialdehyde dehydrogenase
MERVGVGIVGATGAVGQRLVSLLVDHPWFEIVALAGSGQAAGRLYGDSYKQGAAALPPALRAMPLAEPDPAAFAGAKLVFSALPAEVAQTLEPALAAAGLPVVSNASAFRMAPDVPLLIPEVNADHLRLIPRQRLRHGRAGFIVANPNCSTIHLTLALAPLERAFGLRAVQVTTLQAISGAGLRGVAGLEIIDNVIPYIGGEEEKVEQEPRKLLGRLEADGVAPADFVVSAQCTRTATTHGHLEMVSLALRERASLEDVRAAWESWRPLAGRDLPSAPAAPVIVRDEPDRPQPRLDRDVAGGMASVVGRLRPCPILDYKFAVLGHNLVRGAAGGVLLIAELLRAEGWV